jgi:anti-sigma factor RsiW
VKESHLGDALHAYVDNELSVERALEVRAHLASCPQCQKDFERLQALRDVLQRNLKPAEPSAAFLKKLRQSVRRAEPVPLRRRAAQLGWVAGPLAAAALAILFFAPTRAPGDVTGEVVAAHLRSLQANHLTDVLSSDRHTVKPWFEGKVPFSFPVRDFRDQGYTLEGGRLDYLGGQAVAALVYRTGKHAINVFVWPAQGRESPPRGERRNGIQSVHWVSDGMSWWLVSDTGSAELLQLASLLQGAS